MKKRILSILFALCIVLSFVPVTAFASDSGARVGGVEYDSFDNAAPAPAKTGWEDKEYTVTFDTAGGSTVPDKTVDWDDELLDGVTNPTRDGFQFAGWKFNGNDVTDDTTLGDLISDETEPGITLTANWVERITLTVPFTTTVKLGDTGEPGETTFDLAIVHANTGEDNYANVTVSGTVTTNGVDSYPGTLTLTGTFDELRDMLCEGAFVQQVNGGEANWTYDDTVWALLLNQGAIAYSLEDENDDESSAMTVKILPAFCESTDNEPYYYFNGDGNWEDDSVDEMVFTNVYTKHAYIQTHDEGEHWNECACGDVQNKEAHKYGEWKVTKEATQTAKGEKEHICSVCGYAETAEIAQLPKTDSPKTGDNSHMTIWVTLLAVSAAGVVGLSLYGKKRKYYAK